MEGLQLCEALIASMHRTPQLYAGQGLLAVTLLCYSGGMNRCALCAAELDWRARADARYCSGRCRVAAHRARRSTPPAELRHRDRWVRHTAKRPVTVEGRPASVTAPATWTSYQAAAASPVGDGLGFVLDGDGIVCVDLDHCLRSDGSVEPWAERILGSMPPTYVEVSISGTGLHVFGWAASIAGRRFGDGVEVYGSGRFIAVTGRRFRGAISELADVSAAIDGLLAARVSAG